MHASLQLTSLIELILKINLHGTTLFDFGRSNQLLSGGIFYRDFGDEILFSKITLNLRLYHRYDLRHKLLPEMCLDSYFPTQKNLKSYSKNEILYFMINYST